MPSGTSWRSPSRGRGGKVVHCLTLNFSPDRLTQLLLRQQLPATWVAAINDRQRQVVARSVLADARVGKPMVEWFAAATQTAESGIVTGPLMDGRLGQVAFQRLQEVPWIVALAVPVAELQSAAPIWVFSPPARSWAWSPSGWPFTRAGWSRGP